MDRIKDLLKIALLGLSLVVVGNLWWNIRGLLQDLRSTTTNLRDTSREFHDYWSAQREVLESTKNQKAVEAALAVGATYQATGRLINTQVIPAILRQLEAGTLTTHKLSEVADEATGVARAGRALVAGAAEEVNTKLLPEITAGVQGLNRLTGVVEQLSQGTGASAQEVLGALNHTVQSGDLTVQILNQKLADPKLDDLVTQVVETMRHTKGVAKNVEDTTAEFPPIARWARKVQKPITFAQLISILVGIFKPL